MEQMGARCVGLSEYDAKTSAFQDRGELRRQDAEGNQIFENLEDSEPAAPANGKATILGGTGKFAGISGGYDYQPEFKKRGKKRKKNRKTIKKEERKPPHLTILPMPNRMAAFHTLSIRVPYRANRC